MNKQILIILLLIILILSLSVSASEMPENPEDYLELAKKISEEHPEHALPFYTFAYIFSNDKQEKNEIENRIVKFRKKHDDQRGYGYNQDKNVVIEFLLLSKKGKENYS